MKNIFVVTMVVGLSINSSLAIKCYGGYCSHCNLDENDVEPSNCSRNDYTVSLAEKSLLSAWNRVNSANDTAGIIDGWGEVIKEKVGIDLTKVGATRAWTEKALKDVGLDFDVSNKCYVKYPTFERVQKYRDRRFEEGAKERDCGAQSGVGDHVAKLVNWFKDNEYGGTCFKVPDDGDISDVVCLCNKDGCNKNAATAKKAMGINPNAKVIQCKNTNGMIEYCPVKNMKEQNLEFNNACYTLTDNGTTSSGCFTKAGLFEYAKMPEAETLTSSTRKVSQGSKTMEIYNLDGNRSTRHYIKASIIITMLTIAYFT